MSNGFYGVHSIGDHLLLNQLEENIDNYLDYNFQKIGGWVNVNIPRASIRKNLLHQELVEFTTRSGLLLDLDTASLCEQYNNDGPLPCTDLSALKKTICPVAAPGEAGRPLVIAVAFLRAS